MKIFNTTFKNITDTNNNCKVGKITSLGRLIQKVPNILIEFKKEDFKISIDEFVKGINTSYPKNIDLY